MGKLIILFNSLFIYSLFINSSFFSITVLYYSPYLSHFFCRVKTLLIGADLWSRVIELRRSSDDIHNQFWTTTLNVKEEFRKSWKVRLGLLIRQAGPMWREALGLSAILRSTEDLEHAEEIKTEAEKLFETILGLELSDVLNVLPAFNGNEVRLLIWVDRSNNSKSFISYCML